MIGLLLACSGPGTVDVPDDTSVVDSPVDTGDSLDDTGQPMTWTALPQGCDPADDIPEDPLNLEGSRKITQEGPGQFFVELLDVEHHGDRVYAVGQGGIITYDVSDPTDIQPLSVFPEEQAKDRYHKVEVLAEDIVAVTHPKRHLRIVDLSTKQDVFYLGEQGMEGLAQAGGRLYVSDRNVGLRVFDISDLATVSEVTQVNGLANTWELAVTDDGWLYAADAVLGLVPFDLSDPDAPVMGTPIAVEGSINHVRAVEDHILVSNGSRGVAVFERSDPAAPSLQSQLKTGGSVTQTDAADGVLWAADHESVTAWDFSDPNDPRPLHRETTEQFALAVRAGPTVEGKATAFVGDWSILGYWTADPSIQAPRLELATRDIYLWEEERIVEVRNHGGLAGDLLGYTGQDLVVEASSTTVEPGGSAWLRITTTNPQEGATRLCVAAEDPQEPIRDHRVLQGDTEGRLGDPAPDFTLDDLDGTVWTLSELQGKPVMITYFATW